MNLKRVIIPMALALTILMSNLNVQAVNVKQIPKEDIDGVYNQSIDSNSWSGWAKGPHVYSEAGIVMDADTGAILYAKNIDDPHYPASITKVLTGLVALENSELTDKVTVTPEDYNFLKRGDNHIGLKNGEEITMEDALHGTLLASGNEAAHAVGSNTNGGYDNFIRLMNEKAKSLGCMNSNFVNTHGLHDDNHYTSARDMALIGSACFQNEEFMRITGTKLYTIPETNITNEKRSFENHHKMLFDYRSQYYEYCVGGKTGYTDKALNTLVTFASKDGMNLVAVVLRTHGSGNAYVDTRAMLEYAYANFTKVLVSKDMAQIANVKNVDNESYITLPMGIPFEDLECSVDMPTELGNKKGVLIYSYEGHEVGKVKMTVTDKYYNETHGIEDVKEETKKEKEKKERPVLRIIIMVVFVLFGVVLVLFLLLLCYAAYRRHIIRKRRKKRQKRREEYQRYLEQRNRE